MLTPRFTLSQNEDHVIAHIETPYVKFSDGEMLMQGNEFSFYCKPYHLKLYFSQEIIENGTESANYDVDAGTFTIKIPKVVKGEVFTDLDMLTKLMTNCSDQKMTKASALIEVMQSSDSVEMADYTEGEIDWSAEQAVPHSGLDLSSPKYGFNLKTSGLFSKRTEEGQELLDIIEPDKTPLTVRGSLQKEYECQHFDTEHYLADLTDDDIIQEVVTYKTAINRIYFKIRKGKSSAEDLVAYTQDEVETILRFPKKEYILDESQTKCALLGLVDILYASLYDIRTTMDESTVESAWTARKLSSTLSWLVSSSDLHSVVISSLRRSLCFPLYRHWILAMKVLDDLHMVLTMGKKQVLKCLLYIHKQFNNTECYHILNDLYITDYCIWIQTISEKCLKSLALEIEQLSLSKHDLNLHLIQIEKDHSAESTDSDDSSDEDLDISCSDSNNSSRISDNLSNDLNDSSRESVNLSNLAGDSNRVEVDHKDSKDAVVSDFREPPVVAMMQQLSHLTLSADSSSNSSNKKTLIQVLSSCDEQS